jgi:hypothetical protein
VENRNEARIIRDLSPLLVPSAEVLHVRGAMHLKHLIENVDESWIKSIPLGTRVDLCPRSSGLDNESSYFADFLHSQHPLYIHQLFPIKTLRLMSASNVNLSVLFCGVSPMHLIPYSPRLECRFPRPFGGPGRR